MTAKLGFGFIHGGFHGAWCWDEVRSRLLWPSVAVDLPGRSGSPDELRRITHEDWIESAAQQIGALDADHLVLVAHSLGGITLAPAATRLGERVRHAIFIAAVMPPEGGRFADLGYIAENQQGAWPCPPTASLTQSLWSGLSPAVIKGLAPRLTRAEPLGPLLAPVSRSGLAGIGVTLVRASRDATGCLDGIERPTHPLRLELPGATVATIDSGHSLILSAPEEVVAILDRCAREVLSRA